MKTDFSPRILAYFAEHPFRRLKTKELARVLHIGKQGDDYQQLKASLRALHAAGAIERVEGRKWAAVRVSGEATGIIRIHPRGYGTVTTDEEPPREIRVSADHLADAVDGDHVLLRTGPDRKGNMLGEVLEVVDRPPRLLVGKIRRLRGSFILEPDGRGRQPSVMIPSKKLHGAGDGDKVLVDVAGVGEDLQGTVTTILGRHGDERVEMAALALRYGFSMEFPPEVNAETGKVRETIEAGERKARLDLRDEVIFTIDPVDARDFDDAVSLTTDGDGNHLLGVHIADVSHYVRPGTAMDREALRRGTSVYLVDGAIPMLPERLSNGICSLEEGKDRLTYSVFMTLTPRGKLVGYRFEKSLIRSKRRFTYEEAEEIIRTGRGEFADELLRMHRLSQILMRKRFRDGGIDFNVPEVRFVLDDKGYPLEILPKPRLQSMRLIEEFMLLANQSVALSIQRQAHGHKILPFLYRVHDLPDPEKVAELTEFIRHLGIHIVLDPASSKSFQRMLESLNERPESAVVQDVTIRSMAKAAYSASNIGHFGLGFKHYTHFTSPIRRYPDLVVHRLLAAYMAGESIPYSEGALMDIARSTSASERNAIEAERESVKIKELEYMKRHIGDEFDAVISGVRSFGLFVELIPTMVEGLVHVRSLSDDYYEYDEGRKAFLGQRRRKKYRLGDKVRVRVLRSDVGGRQLDFTLV